MNKELGIYIHIPFCKQKCYYCDFVSFSKCEDIIKEYVESIIEEINQFDYSNYDVTSIYIGGGTPSYIKSEYIVEIVENIKNKINCTELSKIEITIEVNPGTVTTNKLLDYKKAGINRLSIGLQTTNDNLLEEIGRIHNYETFTETYGLARKIGFNNLNIDLMFGLPGQTITDLKESIDKVTELQPNHISVYSLIVEDNTKIKKLLDDGKLKLPDEETERQMYWYIKNKLELKGYEHYEISNFSKKGKESRHNLNCWKQKEYIGIGLSAHSYLKNKRFSNITNLHEYIENIKNQNYSKNIIIEEIQDIEMQKKEFMMLGLRMVEGVSIKDFKNKFSQNPLYEFRNEINRLVEQKLLEVDLDKIKLTNKGLDFANIVFEEFI